MYSTGRTANQKIQEKRAFISWMTTLNNMANIQYVIYSNKTDEEWVCFPLFSPKNSYVLLCSQSDFSLLLPPRIHPQPIISLFYEIHLQLSKLRLYITGLASIGTQNN